MFFLLPIAPRTCCGPVRLLANSRYQKGYQRKATEERPICLDLMTPPPLKNKPQNKYSEAPDIKKDHKPLLSRITVFPEKSLLSRIPRASYCGHPSPCFSFSMFWREQFSVRPCTHPPPSSEGGDETKQDITSSQSRCCKMVNSQVLLDGLKTRPPVRKDPRSLKEMWMPLRTSKSESPGTGAQT